MGFQHLVFVFVLLLRICESRTLLYRPNGRPRLVSKFSVERVLNDRPIIGVATQETEKGSPYGDTFIQASYIKYLEQAGARVVAVRAAEPLDYYADLFSKLNGIVFPGGGVSLTESQYARTGRIAYQRSLEEFDKSGEIFPVWGTCLGFELLNVITAGKNVVQDVDAENITLPLHFVDGFLDSRMLGQAPSDVLKYLSNESVAQNEHHFGILIDAFKSNKKLSQFYHVLSTSVDRQGKTFVSTFEAFKYPVYGVQWHPEKNAFKWDPSQDINHSEHAVRVQEYFADFFVNEARKSSHRFPSAQAEAEALIDNFNPVYIDDGSFHENYFFNFTRSAIKSMKDQGTDM